MNDSRTPLQTAARRCEDCGQRKKGRFGVRGRYRMTVVALDYSEWHRDHAGETEELDLCAACLHERVVQPIKVERIGP